MEADTSLSSWGTSRAVRIPKKMCDKAGIGVGSRLTMTSGTDRDGEYILIRPTGMHRSYGDAPFVSIDELFANHTGAYQPAEFDWGEDVGAEVIP
jgi:antitoxin MazE